jgi:hypothetical protein
MERVETLDVYAWDEWTKGVHPLDVIKAKAKKRAIIKRNIGHPFFHNFTSQQVRSHFFLILTLFFVCLLSCCFCACEFSPL